MLFLLKGLHGQQFVGSKVCGSCHASQFQIQSQSGHARALSKLNEHPLSKLFPAISADWAFGAGQHAVTFVSRVDDGHYLEHGLSFYSATKAMALTPGHSSEQGTRYRVFSPDAAILRCFQCHSTGQLKYESKQIVPFEPGVRCETCHGPGSAHVAEGGRKSAINNPGQLRPAAINDFCGSCHRKIVADEVTNWMDPWNVRHQPLYFSQSRCFRESGERLSCFTCHPPHQAAVVNIDTQCRSCHQKAHAGRGSCVTCHMPQVKLNENLSFSNHWIGVYAPRKPLMPISQRR